MAIVIGVVGPHDLVDQVAATCEEQPGVSTLRLDYDHESQAPAIVEAQAGSVEGWLFTGIVPYMLSRDAEALSTQYGLLRFAEPLSLALRGCEVRTDVDLARRR